MEGIENSSTLRLIENLKYEVKRGKKDCQSEAIALFKKIFEAIDSHTDTPSVNKGLNDLSLEVCGLQAKLSIITRQRDNLLDTVDNLRAEIIQLSAKLLPTMQPLQPSPIMNHSQGILEVKSLDNGNRNTLGQDISIPRIHRGGGDQQKHSGHGETTYPIVQQQIKNPLYHSYYSEDYDINEAGDADIKEIEHVSSEGEAPLTKNIIRGGHDNMKKNDNQDYGYEAAQQMNLENQKTPDNKKANKRFKCDQCPYSAVHQYQMKAHVEAVHEKIKKFRCEECGYASSRKDGLERHMDALHNVGDKKYKCGRCPYSAAQNAKLKMHVERVH